MRLSLYFVREDATKAVRGVTSTLVYTADTTTAVNNNPLAGIRKVASNGTDTVDFMYGAKLAAVRGFKRLSTTGSTGTAPATLCIGGAGRDTCDPAYVRNMTLNYTLLGTGNVDEALKVPYVTPVPTAIPTASATP